VCRTGALITQLGSCLWGQRSAPIHTSDPLGHAAISLGNRCIDIFDQEPDARRHVDHDRVAGARVTAAREDLVGVPVDAEPVTSLLDQATVLRPHSCPRRKECQSAVAEGRRAVGRVDPRFVEGGWGPAQPWLAPSMARDRPRHEDEAGAVRLHVRAREQGPHRCTLRKAPGAGTCEGDGAVPTLQGFRAE
jgi:hypothetical protein